MALQPINLGAAPNDGTGDDLRTAGGKINDNFSELYDLPVLSDGDKGDITVSASGATWTIDTGVIDKANLAQDGLTAGQAWTWDGAAFVNTTVLTPNSGDPAGTKSAPVAADQVFALDSEDLDGNGDPNPKLVPAGAFAFALLAQNAQAGTAYTLVLADAGRGVTMSNAGANTVTIPANASVALPIGAVVNVVQAGTGVTTITGDTGVTVNGASAGSVAVAARYQGISLWKVAEDEWIASGAIA